MRRFAEKISRKKGLPPGTLVHVGEKKTEAVKILVIDYNESNFNICDVQSISECDSSIGEPRVRWVDVVGIHRVDVIEEIGRIYNLHPLVMEDILNTNQRPKIDDWDDYSYMVLKALQFDAVRGEIVPEQISIILGRDFVVTLQEREGDDFIPVIDRILNDRGRVRKSGADYLVCALIDSIVDNYFGVIEKIGERIEAIEDELITDPREGTAGAIHSLKREMIFLRKAVWPLREAISALERGESSMINDSTLVYFKDVYDHVIQIIDTIELFRDMLSGMIDVYLSSINNRMNQVMKLLTVITTIFIPLSFIAGVYGMNFRFMPELEWRWGYFSVILIMISTALFMVYYFRRKKWL